MLIILEDGVRITRQDAHGLEQDVVTHGPGQFSAEIAALIGHDADVLRQQISRTPRRISTPSSR